ncbi:hypothetical protein [Pseudoduganella sp. UC29_71]|jgi:cysteinyl-tRNA synthetase|uniref:hypothetical protein n=1 Tax=Pseudoduganella sp. UC29_71 TaxID=3350174 RepID=UPI00366AD7F0
MSKSEGSFRRRGHCARPPGAGYREALQAGLNQDLNTARVLALMWELLRSGLPGELAAARDLARSGKRWAETDATRRAIEQAGYAVRGTAEETVVEPL